MKIYAKLQNISRTYTVSETPRNPKKDSLIMQGDWNAKMGKPTQIEMMFDLEKLRDPNILDTFQAPISRKFHLFLSWREIKLILICQQPHLIL